MRATHHNARGQKHSKNGFNPKHNDRDFEFSHADNIDPERVKNDLFISVYSKVWYRFDEREKYPSFEKAEEKFYKKHFQRQWLEQNKRYEEKRNYDRIKSFDEWRTSKRYCPEETFTQIGNVDAHIDEETLKAICLDYMKFEREWGKEHKCYTVLDAAFHFDEAVPQFHSRKVWHSKDDNGQDRIGQNEALAKSGLELPNPNEPIGKDNNYKITYDRLMRQKLLDICAEHGVDIERIPLPEREHDMSKQRLLTKKQQAEIKKQVDAMTEEQIIARYNRIQGQKQGKKQRGEEFEDLISP